MMNKRKWDETGYTSASSHLNVLLLNRYVFLMAFETATFLVST